MMAAFVAEGKQTNRPRLLLTAAVSAGKGTIDSGYQIAQIGQFVQSPFSSLTENQQFIL